MSIIISGCSIPYILWRYIRPSEVSADKPTIAAFTLRGNESYLSMSSGNNPIEGLHNITSNGFQAKDNGGIASVKVAECYQNINTPNNVVSFSPHHPPVTHYGLHYLTTEETEVLRIKHFLIRHVDLYAPLKNISCDFKMSSNSTLK